MDLLTSCLPGQLRPLTCEFLFMGRCSLYGHLLIGRQRPFRVHCCSSQCQELSRVGRERPGLSGVGGAGYSPKPQREGLIQPEITFCDGISKRLTLEECPFPPWTGCGWLAVCSLLREPHGSGP